MVEAALPLPDETGISRMLRSQVVALITVALLWAIAYLPNLGTRPLRLEEGRRATPAREMLQTGNFTLPTLYGEPYLNKPPMFFWVVAACGWVQGEVNALSTRLPSVLALLAGAALITRFARKDLPAETRNLSALLLLATVVMIDKGALGEIESFLAFLLLAAMVCWRWGYRDASVRWIAWPLTGLVLGAAALTKGPPAIAEFYLPLLVFLLWQRQLKLLIAPAHLVCVVLMIVPATLWVWALYAGNPAGFHGTIHIWLEQMGVDRVANPTASADTLHRYLIFPLETLTTFSPWIFFMIPAFVPRWARQLQIPEDLRRFLICFVLVTFFFFWAWPSARPRHMMAICFPIVSLAAICLGAAWRRNDAFLRAALPVALGITVGVLAGRGVFAMIKLPKLAATDAPRQTELALLPSLPSETEFPRYTTFTFASQAGDGLYDIEFYFGSHLAAVQYAGGHPDFSALPYRPLLLFTSPQDALALAQSNKWIVRKLKESTMRTPDNRQVPVQVLLLSPDVRLR